MRKLLEKVRPTEAVITLELTSDDGLYYSEPVQFSDNHKEFENNLKAARSRLANRRVWLNARKALTKDEILQLDTGVTDDRTETV